MSDDPIIIINYDEERKEVSVRIRPDINPSTVPTMLMEAAVKSALQLGHVRSSVMKQAETILAREIVPDISPQTQTYS